MLLSSSLLIRLTYIPLYSSSFYVVLVPFPSVLHWFSWHYHMLSLKLLVMGLLNLSLLVVPSSVCPVLKSSTSVTFPVSVCWSVSLSLSCLGHSKSIKDFCSLALALSLSQSFLDQSECTGEGCGLHVYNKSILNWSITCFSWGWLHYIYFVHVHRFCIHSVVPISLNWVIYMVSVVPSSPNFTYGTLSWILGWFGWGRELDHCAIIPWCHHLLSVVVLKCLYFTCQWRKRDHIFTPWLKDSQLCRMIFVVQVATFNYPYS